MSYKDLYNKLNKKVIYAAALSIIGTILSLILIISATNVNSVSIANPIANTGNINPVSISQTEKEEENNIVPLDQIVSGGPLLMEFHLLTILNLFQFRKLINI